MSQFSGPLIDRILDFVAVSLPKIRQMLTQTSAAAATSKQEMAGAASGKAETGAPKSPNEENLNALLDAKLSTALVGELFAIADEYRSKGDYVRSRLALRKLVSRFPDHRLAGLAANSLTEILGK